jgi:uncharacterized protein (TIGR02246 family)
MKGIVIGLATLVLGANAASADTQQDIVALAQRFIAAQKTCNTAELNTIVADDMQFIHVGGMTQDKAAFVAGIGGCMFSNLTLDVTRVRVYGDSTAIVQGTQVHSLKNGAGGTLIVSQVYVKQNGAWKFASHQSTAPAAPPAAKK